MYCSKTNYEIIGQNTDKMDVQIDRPEKINSTQLSDLTIDSALNLTVNLPSDDDDSTRMSATSVSTSKTSTTHNTTGTTRSYPTDMSGYELIGSPANLTSKWWTSFLTFHPNHRDKSQITRCRHCGKEVNYKNGPSGLKTHTMTHKHEIESIKVQFQNERNRKKRKFINKLGSTKKKSLEHRDSDILDATMAWVVEKLSHQCYFKKDLEEY